MVFDKVIFVKEKHRLYAGQIDPLDKISSLN